MKSPITPKETVSAPVAKPIGAAGTPPRSPGPPALPQRNTPSPDSSLPSRGPSVGPPWITSTATEAMSPAGSTRAAPLRSRPSAAALVPSAPRGADAQAPPTPPVGRGARAGRGVAFAASVSKPKADEQPVLRKESDQSEDSLKKTQAALPVRTRARPQPLVMPRSPATAPPPTVTFGASAAVGAAASAGAIAALASALADGEWLSPRLPATAPLSPVSEPLAAGSGTADDDVHSGHRPGSAEWSPLIGQASSQDKSSPRHASFSERFGGTHGRGSPPSPAFGVLKTSRYSSRRGSPAGLPDSCSPGRSPDAAALAAALRSVSMSLNQSGRQCTAPPSPPASPPPPPPLPPPPVRVASPRVRSEDLWAKFESAVAAKGATVSEISCATPEQMQQLTSELGFGILDSLRIATQWKQRCSGEGAVGACSPPSPMRATSPVDDAMVHVPGSGRRWLTTNSAEFQTVHGLVAAATVPPLTSLAGRWTVRRAAAINTTLANVTHDSSGQRRTLFYVVCGRGELPSTGELSRHGLARESRRHKGGLLLSSSAGWLNDTDARHGSRRRLLVCEASCGMTLRTEPPGVNEPAAYVGASVAATRRRLRHAARELRRASAPADCVACDDGGSTWFLVKDSSRIKPVYVVYLSYDCGGLNLSRSPSPRCPFGAERDRFMCPQHPHRELSYVCPVTDALTCAECAGAGHRPLSDVLNTLAPQVSLRRDELLRRLAEAERAATALRSMQLEADVRLREGERVLADELQAASNRHAAAREDLRRRAEEAKYAAAGVLHSVERDTAQLRSACNVMSRWGSTAGSHPPSRRAAELSAVALAAEEATARMDSYTLQSASVARARAAHVLPYGARSGPYGMLSPV
eukprot:TRINITY_DN9516_c0_g1_i2.p1 TRINITY_DN9516_c0_g1~~TRINITY_DN9516_c0_g1_i2.p1  ORF type:complete len:867 (+),score=171.19 TRINITY_DN9516_c0_g1_i2:991-3591(+)